MNKTHSTIPYVIIHNMQSIDGRLTGFPPDLGLYYQIAGTFQEEATLVGSQTMLAAQELEDETDDVIESFEYDSSHPRSTLIIVDSKGVVRNWHTMKKSGLWNHFIALCTPKTPSEYLEYLHQRHIDYIISGENHVDLQHSLETIHKNYNIKRIRVDSGGTLNGILLQQHLVNEISVIISPHLVGGNPIPTLCDTKSRKKDQQSIPLNLIHCEQLDNSHIWLRYIIR
jgi:2,5-diamino-6-(ribosylamino)-4(3H)-pyrimidinone 5'-phosphate reductase